MLRKVISNAERVIAYFPMEMGIVAEMTKYSGGLGVLADDTIYPAAEAGRKTKSPGQGSRP